MRPDPFALPSATNARFLLLIFTTTIGATLVYGWPAGLFNAGSRGPLATDRVGCANDARRGVTTLAASELADRMVVCVDEANVAAFLRLAGLGALFLLAALLLYVFWPSGRHPLRPLAELPATPPVVAARELVVQSGQKVDVRVATLRASTGARALGRLGRYRIVLDAGLLARPHLLRGVLSHELAHIRNRDIDITYLTIALWWAFVGLVAAPALVLALADPGLVGFLWWRLPFFLAVLWLARTAVLRSREFYADLRAGDTESIRESVAGALRGRPARPLWRQLFSHHPHEALRLEVLGGKPLLFRLSPGEALGAGVLLGFAYPLISFLLLMVRPSALFFRDWGIGLVLGLCVAMAIAGSAWRAVQHAIATGGRPPATWPAALTLTVGILIGQLVAPDLADIGSWGLIARHEPLIAGAIAVILFLLCQMFLRWVVLCAGCWLPGAARPRRVARFGIVSSAAVFGLWVSTWFLLVSMLSAGYPTWQTLSVVLGAVAFQPVLALCVAWGCVYPVSGLVRSGRGGLGAAYVAAALIAVGFAVTPIPFHEQMRALAAQAQLWPIFGIFAVTAAGCAGAASVLLGLWRGGRHRTGEVGVLAGLAAMMAAPFILLAFTGHVVALGCATPRLWECLNPSLIPTQSVLGSTILPAFALTTMLAVLGAMAGSLIRRAFTRDVPVTRKRRHWTVATLGVTPAVAAAAIVGWLGTAAIVDATGGRYAITPEQLASVRAYANSVRPYTITREIACTYSTGVSYAIGFQELAGTDYMQRLSMGAVAAASSDDVVLQAMGREAMFALLTSDIGRNGRANRAMINYCTIVAAAPKTPPAQVTAANTTRAGHGRA